MSCVSRPDILSKFVNLTTLPPPSTPPDTMTGTIFTLQNLSNLYVPLMDFITPKVEPLNENTYRVEIFSTNGGEYYGVLFYERAKKGFTNKPLMGGFTCVDAKIQQKFYTDNSEVTPLQVLEWGQKVINNIL